MPLDYNPIQARINIPGSKSMTNRALLLAALADGQSQLSNVLISDDTRVFFDALKELGVKIKLDEANLKCLVEGNNGRFLKQEASIYCDKAGTAARFLLAACASTPGVYHFDADPQLRKRPLENLMKALVRQGAKISPHDAKSMPFTLTGVEGFKGGEIEIDGLETSQYLSGLLISAPFAKSTLTIKTNDIVSRSYVEMTCKMMNEFGVQVRHLHQNSYCVPVPQRYIAQKYEIEPDLSTASYFFAAAAVTAGSVTIQAIDRKQSKQGDVLFLSVLEKMGCKVLEEKSGLTVIGPSKLRGVNIDMRNFSDTFMTLAAIAPFAETPTTITNIGHTRLQESDRLRAMRMELEKLNVKVEEGPDWLRIYPSEVKGGEIDSHQDHRIAMSFSVISLRVPGVRIHGAECVSKTCPQFHALWEALR